MVHNTSNAFLETYATLGQGIRGGTPYASLADGSMLAAAHVKVRPSPPTLPLTFAPHLRSRAHLGSLALALHFTSPSPSRSLFTSNPTLAFTFTLNHPLALPLPPPQDGSHSPALYGTVLYIVDGSPPFRVRSISPKLCISEREIELAISPRCALQYAVGLGIDETHNLALISLGEMDRVMKVAALPLDRLLALARTHTLHDDGVTDSECVTWSTPLSEP